MKSEKNHERSDNLAVIRVEKNSNYTVMANYHLRDDLSLKAKGLMSLMLSLPDDWDYSVLGLTAISQESANTINKCLKELEGKGYLVRERKKEKKSGKFTEVVYTLYEKPHINFPHMDSPHMDSPHMENCAQLNTKQSNTKKENTNKKNIYGEYRNVKLTDDEVEKIKRDYPNMFDDIIVKLDEYKEQTGKKYKNDYLAIKKWVAESVKESKPVSYDRSNPYDTLDKPQINGSGEKQDFDFDSF